MKMNKWTLGLAAVGLISLTSAQAEEAKLVPLMTAVSATTISGYVDTSAQWNLGSGNGNPAPYAFNGNKQDGFNLNSVDLRIAKEADETQWSAGYMVDLLFGPDSFPVTEGASFGDNGDSLGGIRQAYVDLRAPIGNGLGFKVGRFDGVIGYESTDSYKNPNFTRSYGYTLEPTEHTGILAHYNFTEYVALDAGVANTVSTSAINNKAWQFGGKETQKSYLGLLTLTAPKSWGFLADDTLVVGVDYGPGYTSQDKTHIYAGSTIYTCLKGLSVGVAYDAILQNDLPGAEGTYATALGGYVVYKPEQKKWGTALRVEYARGNSLGALSTSDNDFKKVLAVTGTVSYDLWANVLTRLEVRWDHALDASQPFGGTVAGASDENNEVAIMANLVYKF